MVGMVGRLVALSTLAKSRNPPDICLDGATAIGRAVGAGTPGLLPVDWAQVSGKHCRIAGGDEGVFVVHDSSTNGTFVIDKDGACSRVPKGGTLPLQPGQTLRLSTAPAGPNSSNLLEYRLELGPVERHIRKADAAADAGPAKRACLPGDNGSAPFAAAAQLKQMQELQQRNKDLRQKLASKDEEVAARQRELAAKDKDFKETATQKEYLLQKVADAEAARAKQAAAHHAAEAASAARLNAAEEAAEAAANAQADLKEELLAKQGLLAEKEEQLQGMEDQVQAAKHALLDSSKEQQEKVDTLREELNNQMAAHLAERCSAEEHQQRQLEEAQGEAQTAKEAAQMARETHESLQQQLTDLQHETADMRQQKIDVDVQERLGDLFEELKGDLGIKTDQLTNIRATFMHLTHVRTQSRATQQQLAALLQRQQQDAVEEGTALHELGEMVETGAPDADNQTMQADEDMADDQAVTQVESARGPPPFTAPAPSGDDGAAGLPEPLQLGGSAATALQPVLQAHDSPNEQAEPDMAMREEAMLEDGAERQLGASCFLPDAEAAAVAATEHKHTADVPAGQGAPTEANSPQQQPAGSEDIDADHQQGRNGGSSNPSEALVSMRSSGQLRCSADSMSNSDEGSLG